MLFIPQDIDVEITYTLDTVDAEDIAFKLTFRNNSDFPRTVSGTMALESTWFTGIIQDVTQGHEIRDLVVPAEKG